MLSNAPIVPYIPVSDVKRARAFYEGKGAGTSKASTAFWTPGIKTVNSIATGGGARTAWFKDTEGNILAISQSETTAR
jgi:hypothetical protein